MKRLIVLLGLIVMLAGCASQQNENSEQENEELEVQKVEKDYNQLQKRVEFYDDIIDDGLSYAVKNLAKSVSDCEGQCQSQYMTYEESLGLVQTQAYDEWFERNYEKFNGSLTDVSVDKEDNIEEGVTSLVSDNSNGSNNTPKEPKPVEQTVEQTPTVEQTQEEPKYIKIEQWGISNIAPGEYLIELTNDGNKAASSVTVRIILQDIDRNPIQTYTHTINKTIEPGQTVSDIFRGEYVECMWVNLEILSFK